MKIHDLKTKNLNRICEKKNIKAAELGRLLDAKVQHGSQLLKGKSPLGDKTISKLAMIWDIDELEFIRRDDLKDGSFMCGWNETEIEYCQKLKNVLEKCSKDDIDIIKNNIDVKYKSVETRKKGTLKQTGT